MKPKLNIIIIVTISLAIISSSCRQVFFDCIKGNDEVKSEIRQVDAFYEISSAGSFDVFVSYDSVHSVEVIAEENLISYIETFTENGKLILKVDNNRCLRENYPIKIFIKTPEITEVELLGSGSIECFDVIESTFNAELLGSGDITVDLNVTKVEALVAGSGQIRISGIADNSELTITGSGEIRALLLEQRYSEIEIAGSGNIYLFAEEEIYGRITGSGNVYYTGNPLIDITITGTGDVRNYN